MSDRMRSATLMLDWMHQAGLWGTVAIVAASLAFSFALVNAGAWIAARWKRHTRKRGPANPEG